MKKIIKINVLLLIFFLMLSSLTYAGDESLFGNLFKGMTKDKKAKDVLSAMAMKYLFGAMGTMMSGAFKIDCDYKLSIYPSDYAKKVSGGSKPVGSFVMFAKGAYINVSPNIVAVDGKSNFIDIQVLKKGNTKTKVALPLNKIYTEIKDFDDIFKAKDKIEKILPIPKKGEKEPAIIDGKDIKKAKDTTKVDINYIGLSQVNNEKVHQVKFKLSDKKNNKEMFTIMLDATDPAYDLRRLSFDHKLIRGNLLLNKLAFEKADIKDVNTIESAFQGYKKVSLEEFKDVLYSSLIVNIFRLFK